MFGSESLTLDTIIGTVCGYLFLGLAWAVIFSLIEDFRPGSFEISPSLISVDGLDSSLRQVLTYFSFVTLTTIGYGDVLPTSPTTRTCAWIEGIMGQFYLAVIVAGLVSMLVTKAGKTQD